MLGNMSVSIGDFAYGVGPARGMRLIPDTAGAVCAGQGIACRLIDAGLLAASFGRGGVSRRSIIRRPRVRREQRPMHN